MKNNPEYVNPNIVFQIENWDRTCFLKNIINNPQIIVGDYTYYDDVENVYNFEKNVLYLFDFMQDKLIIGKFCQIASGTRFIMNGANHAMDGVSTYPFEVFGKSWKSAPMNAVSKGDTVIGNDVWFGNSSTIMPGIKIGHGAIIGTNALVTKNIEPYSVVGGNPATLIRKRFDEQTIDFLMQLAWWNWSIEKITENVNAIATGDLVTLKNL
jgi:virginiamycin A acetyltransferase